MRRCPEDTRSALKIYGVFLALRKRDWTLVERNYFLSLIIGGEIRPIDDRLEEAISALKVEYVLVEMEMRDDSAS